ncbi:MAG: type I DNA topoisomerase [Planctomycetota bacterium]
MAKKAAKKKKTAKRAGSKSAGASRRAAAPNATGKHLVIVESPTKAKTINRYLGPDYVVMASVGHVRDLPKSPPKGAKRKDHPVPGVDLEHDFKPTYEVMPDSKKTVTELKKAAKQANDIWFATDLDREGEAIAWHLTHALGVSPEQAKRVVFNAITKGEIEKAFAKPRNIEQNRVDAQQARRILDRIVGYQVSPLLWKKVAGGLSAGRVQSVATRLVVEREREIAAFVPDEYWKLTGLLTTDAAQSDELGDAWREFINRADPDHAVTVKDQNAWLSDRSVIKAELVEWAGKKLKVTDRDAALKIAESLGYALSDTREVEDEEAKGPAQNRVTFLGGVGDAPDYTITAIETKRTKARPSPPFITSTLQQQASTRLGFNLKRTMRVAQQLYEGIDLKGARGQTGLITYMRTDSTHLTGDALSACRNWVEGELGNQYLPEKPNFYKSSNKDAQEAHEAIRPTDVSITPGSIRDRLNDEQYKLYDLVWRRFVACQMVPAEWDATSVDIAATTADGTAARFRATGRTLVFDGHYKVMGVPKSDDVNLPKLEENQPLTPIDLDPTQHFTSPPPRYTEASLQKKLEEEGIGRPSTYAAIIGTIQDRKYVEPLTPRDKRLRATDLGQVVTDKLIEAFPNILEVGFTRRMEDELDRIESDKADWVALLHEFYGPFKEKLEGALESMTHAKAETEPAPYDCPTCGAPTVYRFGKNGKFLSCSTYPDCKYAAPIDAKGRPQEPELTDILCPEDGQPMIRRTGRFGPFLASSNYPEVKYILKLDPKTGAVKRPVPDPMPTGISCPKCGDDQGGELVLRESKNGLWLACNRFPKCRGRLGFSKLDEAKQKELEAAWAQWLKDHPVPEIKTTAGVVLTDDAYIPRIAGEQPAGAIGEIGDVDSDAA